MNQTHEDFEVIVVDGNSTDKTRDISEKYGARLIRLKEKSNPAVKRNLGAREAKGDILCFVDSDCFLAQDYLAKVVETLKLTGADAVSGMTLTPPKVNFIGYLTGLEYEDRFVQMREGFVNIAATTCLSIKKEVFEAVGGFREIFKERAVGEDWDLSARMVQMGYRIYHSNSIKVFHDTSDNLQRYINSQFYHAFYRPIHARRYKQFGDDYSSFILSSIFLLNLPCTIRIYRRSKDLKVLALIPLSFLRSFAWIFGAIAGILRVSAIPRI